MSGLMFACRGNNKKFLGRCRCTPTLFDFLMTTQGLTPKEVVMQFGYTIIYVPDVVASLAFFTRAFGLARRFLHESGTYGEVEFPCIQGWIHI